MVIESKKGHVLINMDGKYENHGHIRKLDTAKMVIKLIKTKKVPDSNYLRQTVLRVSLDEKYKAKVRHKIAKDKDKQPYVKYPKGVIK